jgi:WD40 repeat protein
MLSNASSGQAIALVDLAKIPIANGVAWSPDGQWIAAIMTEAGRQQLVKIKPVPAATPVILRNTAPVTGEPSSAEWSPAGDWILYPSADGMSLVSPEGTTVRKLTPRRLSAYCFSKDGRQVFGIFHNSSGDGAQWQLYSVDVKTGAEKMLAPVDLPASTFRVAGFSLHPDGKRFLTSSQKLPYQIWMLEGFNQERSRTLFGGTWLGKLLRL